MNPPEGGKHLLTMFSLRIDPYVTNISDKILAFFRNVNLIVGEVHKLVRMYKLNFGCECQMM